MLKKLLRVINKIKYKNLNFTVVANNCWGGEMYKLYSKEFNTPFIGLFIMAPDFIKLVENFNFYITKQLEFIENTNVEYPIGRLDDIEIHFMHYKNAHEAHEKWERRKARFLKFLNEYPDNVFFKMCDRDGGNATLLKRFHKTEHKNKISFCTEGLDIGSPDNIIVREKDGNSVPDGVKLFYLALKYFDLHKWISKRRLEKYRV